MSSEKEEALYDDEDYEDEEMDRARAPKETPLLDRGKADSETMVEVSVRIWLTKSFIDMEEDVQGSSSRILPKFHNFLIVEQLIFFANVGL